MQKEKDPFADLEIDDSILEPEDDQYFKDEDAPPTPDLSQLTPEQLKSNIPAHLRRRSHQKEQELWRMNIVTSASDRLVLRIGTKKAADVMRTRLYHARTYLQIVDKARLGPTYENPLDNWSLTLEEINGVWCIVALRLDLKELMSDGFVEG